MLKFFRCSNDFLWQKVYISRLIRVYVRLIMVSCLFLSFLLITSGDNCVLAKVDWLAACIALRVGGAVLVVFLWRWCYIYHNPPAIGETRADT